ncbi:MAG TPA: hypothetical protein VH186_07825 [Chloroflexia bacterium]|nr:hypothetical protein [Chloroflexia bacterium]
MAGPREVALLEFDLSSPGRCNSTSPGKRSSQPLNLAKALCWKSGSVTYSSKAATLS